MNNLEGEDFWSHIDGLMLNGTGPDQRRDLWASIDSAAYELIFEPEPAYQAELIRNSLADDYRISLREFTNAIYDNIDLSGSTFNDNDRMRLKWVEHVADITYGHIPELVPFGELFVAAFRSPEMLYLVNAEPSDTAKCISLMFTDFDWQNERQTLGLKCRTLEAAAWSVSQLAKGRDPILTTYIEGDELRPTSIVHELCEHCDPKQLFNNFLLSKALSLPYSQSGENRVMIANEPVELVNRLDDDGFPVLQNRSEGRQKFEFSASIAPGFSYEHFALRFSSPDAAIEASLDFYTNSTNYEEDAGFEHWSERWNVLAHAFQSAMYFATEIESTWPGMYLQATQISQGLDNLSEWIESGPSPQQILTWIYREHSDRGFTGDDNDLVWIDLASNQITGILSAYVQLNEGDIRRALEPWLLHARRLRNAATYRGNSIG